jgi:hypothetical protein
MTPRELSIIRCCPEPVKPHVDKAIVFMLAYDHHGINKQEAMELMTRLCESGHLSRLKKGVGKFVYRRTDQGQAAIAGVAA